MESGQQPSPSDDSDQGAQGGQGGAEQDAPGQQPGQQGGREEPLHPGEAFEKMMDHMEKSRQENPTGDGQAADQQPQADGQTPTDPNANPKAQQTPDSQQKSQGGDG